MPFFSWLFPAPYVLRFLTRNFCWFIRFLLLFGGSFVPDFLFSPTSPGPPTGFSPSHPHVDLSIHAEEIFSRAHGMVHAAVLPRNYKVIHLCPPAGQNERGSTLLFSVMVRHLKASRPSPLYDWLTGIWFPFFSFLPPPVFL